MEKNCFVSKVDPSKYGKLKTHLLKNNFEISVPAHTHFSGKKDGISVTLFQSGKCVIQGKKASEFIEFYFEPEILESFTMLSNDAASPPLSARIGIDESGKGDFFGPLCIAGVYADLEGFNKLKEWGVQDSKTLTDAKIHVLADKIKRSLPHQVVIINPKKYNELYISFKNLNTLLGWGHATAITSLYERTGCTNIWIDQFANESVVLNALKRKSVSLQLTQKHKGEEDPAVAAASILARDAFVSGLKRLSEEAGINLPKGASDAVIKTGRKLVEQFGEEKLPYFGKMHFKTLDRILKKS